MITYRATLDVPRELVQFVAKLLADRSLSRLMRSDWPRTLDELETLKRR